MLQEIPNDPELAAAWNALAMRVERPEVFYTYEWAVAAAHAFRETVCPLICLAYDSGQLCGVAPLATVRGSGQKAFFLTSTTADYCDFLSEPKNRSSLLAAALEEIKTVGVRDLELANIPSDSATLRELAAVARSQDLHIYERAAYECGLVTFGDQRERQTLLQTVRQKEREKRGLKKMAKLGRIHLTHVSHDQIESDLRSICHAHISRFLATRRVSPLLRPERRAFVSELAERLSRAGWLRISRLEVGGHPVAWNYGFRFCDSWFWYLPTFKVEHEDLSPGSCLLRLLIEEGCEDSTLRRLDLGLGDEAYKERFANALLPTRHVHLSRSTLRHGQIVVNHWLSTNLKRYQRADSIARTTRDGVRKLRAQVRIAGVMRTAKQISRRTTRYIRSRNELLIFEAPALDLDSGGPSTLSRLDWQHISEAAVQNVNDDETLRYLMRCASRMKKGDASGFFYSGPSGHAKHFLWVRPYDGFYLSEIDHTLKSPDHNATMIFDCWTPVSQRGHGYYVDAIRLAAKDLQQRDKSVWIFVSKENEKSARGISKAGFVCRFSLLRKTLFGLSKVVRHDRSNSTTQVLRCA